MITCSVGVVVALQPGLHTNQIMLIDEKDDVFGPVNLIYWGTQLLLNKKCPCNVTQIAKRSMGSVLTPEVLCQAE